MKKILLTESEKSKIISDKEKLIIESFVKNFNKIKRIDENMLNEADYERGLTINDFDWLNQSKFGDWNAEDIGNGHFAIKSETYPNIYVEVSIPEGNTGREEFGTPEAKEYPWEFEIIKIEDPKTYRNQSWAPGGKRVIGGGKTKNIESSFAHFLQHTLPYEKRTKKNFS